jgi:hypothetical protein
MDMMVRAALNFGMLSVADEGERFFGKMMKEKSLLLPEFA